MSLKNKTIIKENILFYWIFIKTFVGGILLTLWETKKGNYGREIFLLKKEGGVDVDVRRDDRRLTKTKTKTKTKTVILRQNTNK